MNHESIMDNGLNLDTNFNFGKQNGDAIYATTRKTLAQKFGNSIITFKVDADEFLEVTQEEYHDLYNSVASDLIYPHKTIKAYMYDVLYDKIHNLSNNNRTFMKEYIRDLEYNIGNMLQELLMNRNYKGIVISHNDHLGYYEEITIYDLSCIKYLS